MVFLRAEVAENIIEKAEQIAAREKLMAEDVRSGQPVTDVMGKDYETLLGTQD